MIDKVKKILWITDAQYDDYLNTIIPMLKEFAIKYCNNSFLVENPDYDEDDPESEEYIEEIPEPVILFIAKAAEYNISQSGINSESLGDYSVSFETDLPPSITKLLTPYRKVSFV